MIGGTEYDIDDLMNPGLQKLRKAVPEPSSPRWLLEKLIHVQNIMTNIIILKDSGSSLLNCVMYVCM